MYPIQGKSILIIDDDSTLLGLVELAFRGVKAQIYTVVSGLEGLHQFYIRWPDLVILNLMIPELNGWEVCRCIRQVSNVPLIILSPLSQDDEIIRVLVDYGADVYLTKPFNPYVLLAQAQAVLRRAALSPTITEPSLYSDAYLTIASDKRRVFIRGEAVKLSTTEYRLLTYLAQNAGRVLTIQQILENIWGRKQDDNTEYVHAYIWHLRQKLEPNPHRPIYLLTEYGIGYHFEKQIHGMLSTIE